MTCAQGLLRLLWGGPEVGVLRDCSDQIENLELAYSLNIFLFYYMLTYQNTNVIYYHIKSIVDIYFNLNFLRILFHEFKIWGSALYLKYFGPFSVLSVIVLNSLTLITTKRINLHEGSLIFRDNIFSGDFLALILMEIVVFANSPKDGGSYRLKI